MVFTINPGGTTASTGRAGCRASASTRTCCSRSTTSPPSARPGPKMVVPPDAGGDAVPSPAPVRGDASPRARWRCSAGPPSTRWCRTGRLDLRPQGRGLRGPVVAAAKPPGRGRRLRRRGPGGRGPQERLDLPAGPARRSTARSPPGPTRSPPRSWPPPTSSVKYEAPGPGRGQLRLGGPAAGGRPGRSRWATTPASTTPTPRSPGARAATTSPRRPPLLIDFTKNQHRETRTAPRAERAPRPRAASAVSGRRPATGR